jgi:hypothetical protein
MQPDGIYQEMAADVPHEDPRWPKQCACGYVFSDSDHWQTKENHLYRHPETGEKRTLPEWAKTPGAMWNATWMPNRWKGEDGRSLVVVTPGGVWMVDGRATNCTKRYDDTHKCWVRHGNPPEVTVDKNGNTCTAGGGFILVGGYHGFLRNGWLAGGLLMDLYREMEAIQRDIEALRKVQGGVVSDG